MSENTSGFPWPRIDTPAPDQTTPLARFLSRSFPLTWETVLVGVMLIAALVTRLWALDARVMSHDESLHVFYSWQLATGRGFAHNPMTPAPTGRCGVHGPFLFEATALMNVLFGASDFTSRRSPSRWH
ncbi:MAG TPA: hypothetical protein VJG32_16870 [Anaerolineae bacterium]|nr:hypothetical protein [Anaerolineae bacterium]